MQLPQGGGEDGAQGCARQGSPQQIRWLPSPALPRWWAGTWRMGQVHWEKMPLLWVTGGHCQLLGWRHPSQVQSSTVYRVPWRQGRIATRGAPTEDLHLAASWKGGGRNQMLGANTHLVPGQLRGPRGTRRCVKGPPDSSSYHGCPLPPPTSWARGGQEGGGAGVPLPASPGAGSQETRRHGCCVREPGRWAGQEHATMPKGQRGGQTGGRTFPVPL